MSNAFKIGLCDLIETTDSMFGNVHNLVTRAELTPALCVKFLRERGYEAEPVEGDAAITVWCANEPAYESLHQALCCICASIAFRLEAELHVAKARMHDDD
jgi:hypothetical protein